MTSARSCEGLRQERKGTNSMAMAHAEITWSLLLYLLLNEGHQTMARSQYCEKRSESLHKAGVETCENSCYARRLFSCSEHNDSAEGTNL